MLDLSLFKNRTFAGANTVMLLVGLAMFGVFFFVSLYVQQILGYSPIQAGASFLPWTLLIVVLAPQAGRLTDRVGPRWLVTGGMIVLASSLFLFSRMGADETFWGLLPAMILGGVGMSATMPPVTTTAMGSVSPDKAGVGSAVLNSMRQVGGSLGIAVMGAIVASAVTTTGGASEPRRVPDRIPPRTRDRDGDRTCRCGDRCAHAPQGAARPESAKTPAGVEVA